MGRLTTWEEMLARVRRQAKDAEAAVWPDLHLRAVLFDAVKDLSHDCPDSLLDASGNPKPLPFEVDDWNQPLPTDPFYDAALEALCLYKLAASDAADVKDESLARHWLGQYRQATRGAG